MRRKIYTILFGVLLVGIAAFSVAVYKINDLIASYTPTFEQILSDKLGAKVKLGEITLSLFQQELSTTSVSINAPSRAGGVAEKSNPLTVGAIKATANLWALLERRLELEALTIDGLNFVIIRDKSGVKVSGLEFTNEGAGNQDAKARSASGEVGSSENSSRVSNLPLTLALKKIVLKNASMEYHDLPLQKNFISTDLSFSSELNIEGSSVEFQNIVAGGTISQIGTVTARFNSLTSNLSNKSTSIEGGTLSFAGGTVAVKGSYNGASGEVVLSSDALPLKDLASIGSSFAPHFATLSPTGTLSLNLRTEFSNTSGVPSFHLTGPISLSSTNLQIAPKIRAENTSAVFSLDLSPGTYSVTTQNLTSTINGETITSQFSARLKGDRLTVEPFQLNGFAAVQSQSPSPYNGRGTFTLTLNENIDFANQFDGAALSLAKIANALKPELSSVISGTVLAVQNEVFGEVKRVPASLRAHGSAHLVDGAIKGVNLPGLVLKKVEGIPLLQGSLLAFVPPTYQPLFASPDTPYSSILVTYGISGKDLSIKDLKVESDIFSLSGKGTVQASGELNLETTIAFSQAFSLALSSSLPQLRQILTADNRLVFPLQISGTPPKVVVTPNLREVIKLAAQRVVKDKAQDILEKTLGRAVKGWGKGLGF
jgi:hypothetical protein